MQLVDLSIMHSNSTVTTCPHCGFDKWKKPTFPIHCICGTWLYEDGTHSSRGLGDTIAKATTALGIKPCGGCKERQKLLNKLVPYR